MGPSTWAGARAVGVPERAGQPNPTTARAGSRDGDRGLARNSASPPSYHTAHATTRARVSDLVSDQTLCEAVGSISSLSESHEHLPSVRDSHATGSESVSLNR
eukprot:5250483-Prymnesium_polylepis.1